MASVEDSVEKWINSFDYLKIHINDLTELADGIVLFKILNEISPHIWNEKDMDFSKTPTESSRMKNVGYVFAGIQEFFRSKLLNDVHDDEIDVEAIAKYKSKDEILRLCEYTIGVVVQCEEKDEYIGAILNLDEDTQADLMKIIQKNLVNNSQNNSSIGGDEEGGSISHSYSEENLSASITVAFETQVQLDKLKKQNQSLKLKLGDTEEENSQLKAQVAKLTLECKELTDDLNVERKKSKKESTSTDKVEEAIHKLEQVERELEQKKYEYNSQAKNVQLLEQKINEMRLNHTDEKERLTEELEELRSKCRKLEQVEAINNMYKKKLEETTDFKNRLRELEEQNESLLSQLEGKLNIVFMCLHAAFLFH